VGDTRELLQKGGPGGYDIYVDPVSLRAVAKRFQDRLQAFGARQQAFTSGTPHHDGEFGRLPLPETEHVNQQYVKTRQDAVTALQDMATWLTLMAGALSTSADIYDGSDA